MKYKLIKTIAVGLLFTLSGLANAGLIITDTTAINVTAQEHNTTLSLNGLIYNTVFIDLEAKGDYGRSSFENILFHIDGIVFADWTWNTAGITVVDNFQDYDYTLTGTISIAQAVWDGMAADNSIKIHWKNSRNVHAYSSQGGSDYVTYTIRSLNPPAASVPEPSTLAIFALGMIGLASRRFKKQS